MQTVNTEIGDHARYSDWLGGNSRQMLSDNHRHHGLFMEEIFSAGEFQALALSLSWVYHAYHARGVPCDYFQAELGYWKRAVAEAMPGEQATTIIAVYDWMLAKRDRAIGAAELRREPTDGVDPALAELFDALLTALRAFDDDRVLQVVRGARDGGLALPELLQGLIYPLMKRVGTLWEDNEITATDEHEATAIMNRVLAALYFDQPCSLLERGLALVGASANEFHEMGAWMVATCLELDG